MSSGMFAASALSAVPFRDNAPGGSTNATMIDLTADSDDSNDDDGGYFREGVASTSTARPPPPPRRPRQPQIVEVLSDSDNEDEDIIEVDRHGARVPPSSQPSHQAHIGMPDIRPHPRRHPMAVAPYANDAARRRHMASSQHEQAPGAGVNATRHQNAAASGSSTAVPRAGFGGALLTLGGGGEGAGAGPSRRNAHPNPDPIVRPPADDTFRNLARHTLRRRLAYIPLHNPHPPPLNPNRNPFDINDDGGARLGVGGDGFFNLAQLANAWGMGAGMGWGEVDEEQARARAVADIPTWDPDPGARGVHGGRKRAREGFTWDFEAVPEERDERWRPISIQSTMEAIGSVFGSGSGSGPGARVGTKRKAESVIDVSDSSSSASDLDSDVESESGSGSEADLPTLICAGCDTPLVMGGETEEEKIWGLRCGHLICGGCLARIGTPLPLPPPAAVVKAEKGKGKKERTTSGQSQRHSTRLSAAVKGKGKARAVEGDIADEPVDLSPSASGRVLRSAPSASGSGSGPSTSRSTRATRSNAYGLAADSSSDESDTDTAPTSSRTRSHHPSSSSHPSASHPAPSTPSPRKPRTPTKTSKKRKGKGKATIRTFREYEYACPVEDCLRLHTRVLVGVTVDEAKWRGKEEDGEVGVYTG